MVTMKKAIESYYEKCKEDSYKTWGKLPISVYTDELEKSLIKSEEDEDGYIEWELVPIEKNIDFESLEKEFRFKLNEELKSYFSTYLFLEMEGFIDHKYLSFEKITNLNEIEELIKLRRIYGEVGFKNSQIFDIGIASIDDNDEYDIYYDNENGKVFCLEHEDDTIVEFDKTLTEIIYNMTIKDEE